MPSPLRPEPSSLERTSSSGAPHLILAFDFGLRRIGVACADTLSRTAAPIAGITNLATGVHWAKIDSLLREWLPTLLVVGLPYNVDGSESGMSAAVRKFAVELAHRSALPVKLMDERYSSLEAQSRIKAARESGLRRRRLKKTELDGIAACVILERWLTEST